MPSFEQPVTDNQIIITVALSRGPGESRLPFRALVDTGAQVTAISPNVVRSLHLVPTRPIGLTVASGESVGTFQYRARVDIPIGYTEVRPSPRPQSFFMGDQLSVAGLPYQPDGYDVLLGMDIIGIFHTTIYQNRIILSN